MSTLLTMNFRINSGHTTGGEDMRLSVGKRVIPVFVVVAVLIFSTIGLAHMKTELIQQQRVSVQTATCLMKMSLVRAQESAEIDEVHTRRISRLSFSGAEQRVSGWQYASAYAGFSCQRSGAAASAFLNEM